jgi:hypothetical protein
MATFGVSRIMSKKEFMSKKEIMSMSTRISLNVEIPEALHQAMQTYLEDHSAWSQHRVCCAAVSLFLMQNGVSNRNINRLYLDTIFDYVS